MKTTEIPHHILLSAFMASTPDHVYFKDLESRFVSGSDSLARSFISTLTLISDCGSIHDGFGTNRGSQQPDARAKKRDNNRPAYNRSIAVTAARRCPASPVIESHPESKKWFSSRNPT